MVTYSERGESSPPLPKLLDAAPFCGVADNFGSASRAAAEGADARRIFENSAFVVAMLSVCAVPPPTALSNRGGRATQKIKIDFTL